MGAEEHDVVVAGLTTEAERAAHERARRAGVSHLRALAPRAPRPGEPVAVELTAGPEAPPGPAWVEIRGERMELEAAGVEWDTLVWGYVRRYRGMLPGLPAGAFRYRLGVGELEADAGRSQALVVGDAGPPAWAAGAIVYQVWVDRFWAGGGASWPGAGAAPADRYGGALAGLVERLDHVAELGANTVWLNPIHPGTAYHGYEVTDYLSVDPALGTLEDFGRLVSELHERGLRLVLDLVPSHVSHLHPAFVAARADAESPFARWFRFDDWPDGYRSFFGVRTMPRLDHDEPAVREHLVGAALSWLERGVDGFRLDFAHGAGDELWAELRVAARAASPECWLFGEVVETPGKQLSYEGLFDGCLDFELAQALRGAFGYRDRGGRQLAAFLDAHEAAFPVAFSRPSFLDNHDVNRFLWIAGGDARQLRLAALCQYTLQGPPIVYYGTEVGLSQEGSVKDASSPAGDRHARLPMLWDGDQDRELLRFYGELAALRRERPELAAGPRETVSADAASLAYARGGLVVELDLAAGSGSVREGRETLLRT